MLNVKPLSEQDMQKVFQQARDYSSRKLAQVGNTNPPDQHSVSLITLDRQIAVIPSAPPAGGQKAVDYVRNVETLMPRNPPKLIIGIADTAVRIPPNLSQIADKIPFFGYLIGFAYIGHTVIIFEGDQSALSIGLRGADVLLVDHDRVPLLPGNWLETAKREMRHFDVNVWNHHTPNSPVSRIMTSDQNNAKAYKSAISVAEQLARAEASIVHGDYQGALDDLNAVIVADPNNVQAYLSRSKVYRAQKNVTSALGDLDTVIRIDPQNITAYAERGITYYMQENWPQVIPDLTKVIERDPSNYRSLQVRSESYLYLKRFDQALNDATMLVRSYPKQAEPYNIRANVFRTKGDFGAAIADCDRAIRIDPDFYYALINRSLCRRFKRDYKRAIADATTALAVIEKLKQAGKISELAYTRGYYSALGACDGATQDKTKSGK